jgi:hypothetical protein
MKIHRATALAIAFLVTLAGAASAAGSSPLLNGYGGPGQGNQAILGSALLTGGRNGGGGSGPATGGGNGRATRGGNESASALTAGGVSPGPATGRGGEAAGAATEGGVSSASGRATIGPRRGTADKGHSESQSGVSASSYPVSERGGVSAASGTVGLSGGDALLILFALLVLALTGVLTRRLTAVPRGNAPAGDQQATKGSESRLTG